MAAAGAGPAGRRSRFAVTCALLRQYMRENQRRAQMGNLARLFQAPPPPPVAPGEKDNRTMQLFPVRAAMAQPAQERPEVKTTPLTIFYGGQVIMFDNIPADTAKELMQMAGSANAAPPERVVSDVLENPEATRPSAGADQIPIARKASLQRFLKKRKHRISHTDHYHNGDASPAKKIDDGSGEPLEDVPDASWLRL